MNVFDQIASFSLQVRQWKSEGQSIGFVPTMGNLHKGHLSLVPLAQKYASKTIVSLFVNPLQFGPKEDFSSYPRTLNDDVSLLSKCGADAVFIPKDSELYPSGFQTMVRSGALASHLCGAFRPGHFDGVCTVVLKLVNLAQPDVMVLGEKDFQQLQVIRACLRDFNFSVKLISAPTVREPDGLAMSSRNHRLSKSARELAPLLYRSMKDTIQRVGSGTFTFSEAALMGREFLLKSGFDEVQYYEFRRESDLELATGVDTPVRLFSAVFLSGVRLIDNLSLSPSKGVT